MRFVVQHHTEGRFDLFYLIFSEVQKPAFGFTVCISGYGIHKFTESITNRAVLRNNILGGSDLIHSAGKSADCKDGTIDFLALRHGGEHFAGFPDSDDALLRHILLGDYDDRDGIVL